MADCKGVGRMGNVVAVATEGVTSKFSKCFTIFFFIFSMFFSSTTRLFLKYFVWDLACLSLIIEKPR